MARIFMLLIFAWAQAEAASDEIILATEQAEDISLNTLEEELASKQEMVQQGMTHLQHLQVGFI